MRLQNNFGSNVCGPFTHARTAKVRNNKRMHTSYSEYRCSTLSKKTKLLLSLSFDHFDKSIKFPTIILYNTAYTLY